MLKFSALRPVVGTPFIAGPWTMMTDDLVIPRTAGSWLFPADETDEFGFGLLSEFRANVFWAEGMLALVLRPVYSKAGEAAGDDWGFSCLNWIENPTDSDKYISFFDWDALLLTDDVAVMDEVAWGPSGNLISEGLLPLFTFIGWYGIIAVL